VVGVHIDACWASILPVSDHCTFDLEQRAVLDVKLQRELLFGGIDRHFIN